MPRPTDLSAADFALQLKLHGFLHLRAEGRFADVRAKGLPAHRAGDARQAAQPPGYA